MTSTSKRTAFFAALCLGLLTSPAYAETTVSEEAKVYFANGVELLQTSPPSYQDAYYQFKLAYEKSGSWKVLGNLGLCALKLERDGEALANYERYLSEGGSGIEPDERQALVREMALITGNSATVELTFSEADAEVVVTRAGSSVPPQAYKAEGTGLSLGLRAGTQELVATAPDGRKLEWRFVLSPRTRVVHHFDFDAPAPKSGGGSASSSSEGATTGGGVRVAGYVVTGAGLIAIGSGLVVGILSQNKEEDANAECDTTTHLCPDDAARKRRESGIESAENLAQISNILWIGGSIVTAGGLAMIIFGGPTRTDSGHSGHSGILSNVSLAPRFGPNGGALFASGSF